MKQDVDELIKHIHQFNKDIHIMGLEMARNAGRSGSHIGGSFSCMEIFSVLYGGILKYDVKNPAWSERDRFIPSKTHCILANFPALVEAGFVPREKIFSFHEDDGLFAGHPWNIDIGLEYSGGSLGMGLSVGIGMALNAKRKKQGYKTYVLLGDGECNEGSVWEAFMSASKFKLDNLVAIIDYNNMQFDGVNDEIMPVASMSEKLRAFGWKAVDVDGHSIEALYEAFGESEENKPLVVVAHTVKAHGIPSLENKAASHHSPLSDEDYNAVMSDIMGGKYD
jgi:transketolase